MLEGIKTQIGVEHFISKIPRSGCRVYFSGIQGEKLIFDVERFCIRNEFDGKRCDFSVFLKNPKKRLFCILIELQSGALEASTVFEQLKGGASVIEENFSNFDFELIPIVLTSTTHPIERGRLGKAKVLFRGIHYSIALGRCNRSDNLSSAIGKSLEAC